MELGGENQPNSKESALEIMVEGCLMKSVEVIVSVLPKQKFEEKNVTKERRRRRGKAEFIW